jgi:hypothetical protein
MSSGFVSGGTVDNPTERDDEWRQAQAELEAARKAKADLAAQHDGKSLFEILQDNKDKKQAEFEERARYKLHVSLNDEEADYLDSIEERRRKEEVKMKRDTQEQLEAFRKQQEEDARSALEAEDTDLPTKKQVLWAAPGRKRKQGPSFGLLKGVKLRKANPMSVENKAAEKAHAVDKLPTSSKRKGDNVAKAESTVMSIGTKTTALLSNMPATTLSLGLEYPSSEDEN